MARTIPQEKGYVEAITFIKKQKTVNTQINPLMSYGQSLNYFGISSNKFDSIVQNIPLMQKIVNKMEEETKNFNISLHLHSLLIINIKLQAL